MVQKKNNAHKDGLFIPSRQLAAYSSLALATVAACFMGGYFLGKQHAIEHMVTQIEHTAFSDQISASLCNLYDQEQDDGSFLSEARIRLDNESLHQVKPDAAYAQTNDHTPALTQVDGTPPEQSTQFYAQLIGYSTRKAAERFAKKLQKNSIPVLVKERKSSTAQGKQRNWYQVITEPYTDRDALTSLTQRIARQEKIRGIQVIAC